MPQTDLRATHEVGSILLGEPGRLCGGEPAAGTHSPSDRPACGKTLGVAFLVFPALFVGKRNPKRSHIIFVGHGTPSELSLISCYEVFWVELLAKTGPREPEDKLRRSSRENSSDPRLRQGPKTIVKTSGTM